MVFNIFIFDKNGNKILDKAEILEAPKLTNNTQLSELPTILNDLQSDENKQIITSWDNEKAINKLDELLKSSRDLTTTYNKYLTEHLQGKPVITKIGKVWINGETKKEVRKDIDSIK